MHAYVLPVTLELFSVELVEIVELQHLAGFNYSVMQSDRNSLETDTFHEPITYKPHD